MSTGSIKLSDVLRVANAEPQLDPERIPKPALYDPTYRCCVIGLTFETLGTQRPGGSYEIHPTLLKLYQFIAIRPALSQDFLAWAGQGGRSSSEPLHRWANFPRGYVSDLFHERIVRYLIGIGQVYEVGTKLALSESGAFMTSLLSATHGFQAFSDERETLGTLAQVKVTLAMLRAT